MTLESDHDTTAITMKTQLSRLLCSLAICATLSACASRAGRESETSTEGVNSISDEELKKANKEVNFAEHVKPILETKCVMCHNTKTLPDRPSLESRSAAEKTGTMGAYIVPGHPDKSRLVTHIKSGHADVNAMPPVGDRITPDELEILKKWIAGGAEWPKGKAGALNPDGITDP